MLSRVAERTYWLGRYIERTENTARMVSVNANLLLDLPRSVKPMWGDMIDISGYSQEFYSRFSKADERNVIKFMLAEKDNPGSIINSVLMARENARTTREILPTEAWEMINELYLYVRRNVERALKRDGRHKFLTNIINHCYKLTGLMFSGMSHGDAYDFIMIGRNLERADMTTRIVDVGCMNLLKPNDEIPDAFDNILWMNVLRSLSAYQMYRQNVHDRVNSEDVVAFLMKDGDFPRSVFHCLNRLSAFITKLPRNDSALRSISRVQRSLMEVDVVKILQQGLHEFIDNVQIDLGEIHTQVAQTWFATQLEHIEIQSSSQTQTSP